MASEEVVISIGADEKALAKDLKKAEKELEKYVSKAESLRNKMKTRAKGQECEAFGGKTKKESQKDIDRLKAYYQQQKTLQSKSEANMAKYTDKQKKRMEKFEPSVAAGKISPGSLESKMRNMRLSTKDYDYYMEQKASAKTAKGKATAAKKAIKEATTQHEFGEANLAILRKGTEKEDQKDAQALSELTSKIDSLNSTIQQIEGKLNSLRTPKDTPVKPSAPGESSGTSGGDQGGFGRFFASIKAKREAMVAGFNTLKDKIPGPIKAGFAIAGKAGARFFKSQLKGVRSIIPSFKGLNKSLKSFGKRLRNAALQGILLRPIRESFYAIYEAATNAAMMNGIFRRSLANLKGTVWTGLTPAFNAFMPVLGKFMDQIALAVTYITTLINAFFKLKPASKSAAASLAATAMQGANLSMASWDTVQQLQKNPEVLPTYEQSFAEAETAFSGLYEAIEAGNWERAGEIIMTQLNRLFDTIDAWITSKFAPGIAKFGSNLATFLNGMVKTFDATTVGHAVATGLNGVLTAINNFLTEFDATGFGLKIGGLLQSFFTTFDPVLVIEILQNKFIFIFNMLYGILTGMNWKDLGLRLAGSIKDMLERLDPSKLASSLAGLIGAAIGALSAFVAGFAEGLWEIIKDAWDSVEAWWDEQMDKSGGNVILALYNGIKSILAGVGKWIKDNIWTPFIDGFKKAFGIDTGNSENEIATVGEEVSDSMLGGISNPFTSIKEWVNEHIFTPLYHGLCDLFGLDYNATSPSTVFSDFGEKLMEGLKEGIDNKIQDIKDIINELIGFVETAINWVIEKLNYLSIEPPDWLAEKLDMAPGDRLGFDLDKVHLPRLAQGGVVNPGKQFAAVLGDNRYEQEVVSPLSTMKQAFTEALLDSGALQQHDIVLQVDGQTFARLMGPHFNSESTRIGLSATGGVVN